MLEFRHRLGEQITVLRESTEPLTLTIRRVSDGFYFNWLSKRFDEESSSDNVIELLPFFEDGTLQTRYVSGLPSNSQDLLFMYSDGHRERRIFGYSTTSGSNNTCIVYGTLLDVSGAPLSGVRVEAYLNSNGYFVNATGLVGTSSTALTDSSGYFELPLIMGMDVTITIPALGFFSKGKVPHLDSVKLDTRTLR